MRRERVGSATTPATLLIQHGENLSWLAEAFAAYLGKSTKEVSQAGLKRYHSYLCSGEARVGGHPETGLQCALLSDMFSIGR